MHPVLPVIYRVLLFLGPAEVGTVNIKAVSNSGDHGQLYHLLGSLIAAVKFRISHTSYMAS